PHKMKVRPWWLAAYGILFSSRDHSPPLQENTHAAPHACTPPIARVLRRLHAHLYPASRRVARGRSPALCAPGAAPLAGAGVGDDTGGPGEALWCGPAYHPPAVLDAPRRHPRAHCRPSLGEQWPVTRGERWTFSIRRGKPADAL